MRCYIYLLLLLTAITSCSKKEGEEQRTNFAEVTVNGNTFTFTELEAVIDTSYDGNTVNVTVSDPATNSGMEFETLTGYTKRPQGSYEHNGALFPEPTLVFLHLGTYVNRYFGSYSVQNNTLKLIIDDVANGRMHGTLSGKINCYTCTPYDMLVDITGEFEMPVTYK